MKRQRRTEGAIVEIPLGNGRRAFGRLLREPLVEFFDVEARQGEQVEVESLVSAPVAFSIWVMNSATTSGRWRKIAQLPLTESEQQQVVKFCKQDALSGELTVYWTDPLTNEVHEVRASRAECEELERAAVWSAEHVEDRLRDHFLGVPNKWVESLRLSE